MESQKGLLAAILFAGITVSVSVAFLGYQMMGNQKASAIDPNMDPDQLAAILQDLDPGEVQSLLEDLSKRVNVGYDELVDDDAALGDDDAPVTLVEFSDYQCPFCQRHFNQTFPLIVSQYVDTGKLRYVYRDFPLSFHTDAKNAAAAAECAREQGGDSMYFKMHSAIFSGNTGSVPVNTLVGYGEELDLNTSELRSCIDSGRYDSEVDADIAAGARYGVNGTPGFILTDGNKSLRLSGALPFSEFQKEIEALLK